MITSICNGRPGRLKGRIYLFHSRKRQETRVRGGHWEADTHVCPSGSASEVIVGWELTEAARFSKRNTILESSVKSSLY